MSSLRVLPASCIEWTRAQFARRFAELRKPGDELTKIAADIWVTDGPVATHYDSTAPGLVTYGLVLLNDIDLELHYRGGVFPLKLGDAYCIDGRVDHAALHPGGGAKRDGLFAVRVWDIPPGASLAQFVESASTEKVKWIS